MTANKSKDIQLESLWLQVLEHLVKVPRRAPETSTMRTRTLELLALGAMLMVSSPVLANHHRCHHHSFHAHHHGMSFHHHHLHRVPAPGTASTSVSESSPRDAGRCPVTGELCREND